MSTLTIDLGKGDRLALLYSFPNSPTPPSPQSAGDSLAATIEYWFGWTLRRDGFTALGASGKVRVTEGDHYYLDLCGPESLTADFGLYAKALPQFLENGWTALNTVVPKLKAEGKWDPSPDAEPPPYRPWRFFLPHGVAMVRQRSVQFFHYPPIRLLDGTRDYLDDPVPKRWEQLLIANGVASEAEAQFYETVMDAAPIAAADDQGSKNLGTKGIGDPSFGLIPIQRFHDYQRAQMQLLVTAAPNHPGYTIPVVIYGSHPRETFTSLYIAQKHTGLKLPLNSVATVTIKEGLITPVLATHHPYDFYASAQGFATVGGGYLSSQGCAEAAGIMVSDLAAARWQKLMAEDPTQDPQVLLASCTEYWQADAQRAKVCELVRHQGSLYYPDRASFKFEFREDRKQAAIFCATYGNNACSAAKPFTGG